MNNNETAHSGWINKNLTAYKITISIIFGLLGFAVNFYPVDFVFYGSYRMSFLFGLLFPMLITLSWGWKYGLLSALCGGCQTMWILWFPQSGYGPLVSVPPFTLWIVWLGWFSRTRHNIYIGEIIFRIFNTVLLYTVFRWVFTFNVPPHNVGIPLTVVHSIVFKELVNGLLILFITQSLLHSGKVRTFFKLPKSTEDPRLYYTYTNSVILGGILIFGFVGEGYIWGMWGPEFQNVARIIGSLLLLLIGITCTYFTANAFAKKKTEELIQAGKALRESEENYRSIFANAVEGFFQSTPEGRFISVNPAFAGMLGYSSPKELISNISDIAEQYYVNHEDRLRYKQLLQKDGSVEHFEFKVRCKDGSQIWVSNSTRAIYDRYGKIARYEGNVNNITERIQAEEALRESEEKHRLLAENTVDCIWQMNLDMEFTYINQAVFPFLGYTPKEWIGSKLPEHCSSEEIEKMQAIILDALPNLPDKTTEVFETTFYHKNGEEIPCEVSGKIVLDEAGNPIYLQGTTRNITERKQAEEEKKKLEAQLVQAQKMEAIGTLTGGIAHDFNNLLTSIIGNAEIALMDVIKDESLRRRMKEIKKAGDRAASLIRQLLAFSRKQVIKPEILKLNEVINETEKMLKRTIGEDIEFQTILEPELWKVHMDPGQIDQIIINMVVNSRDAMPQGGKLVLETANMHMDESYFREHGIDKTPGSYVMLAISDTGSGMNKETQEHIFEPFFTTKEIGKGTGLGLSTVYGIAKQNNGFIWVYSEPGQGTTFKIYLPKVKEGVEQEEKERTPVGDLNGSETVFIVEDDDRLRNLARKILERYGYSVLEAENGENALKVSEAYDGSIHLMVTDVVMPKMSGKEVAERLQSLRPEIKVIYMSGYTDNAIVHHGVLAPGLNFLAKPFSPEDLARKVREVLNK